MTRTPRARAPAAKAACTTVLLAMQMFVARLQYLQVRSLRQITNGGGLSDSALLRFQAQCSQKTFVTAPPLQRRKAVGQLTSVKPLEALRRCRSDPSLHSLSPCWFVAAEAGDAESSPRFSAANGIGFCPALLLLLRYSSIRGVYYSVRKPRLRLIHFSCSLGVLNCECKSSFNISLFLIPNQFA